MKQPRNPSLQPWNEVCLTSLPLCAALHIGRWRAQLRGGHRAFAMANLSDEERRALNLLAGHSEGCDEAVLLANDVTVGQLAGW